MDLDEVFFFVFVFGLMKVYEVLYLDSRGGEKLSIGVTAISCLKELGTCNYLRRSFSDLVNLQLPVKHRSSLEGLYVDHDIGDSLLVRFTEVLLVLPTVRLTISSLSTYRGEGYTPRDCICEIGVIE